MARADKVGFVVAGAQKGGTTALDHYLREYPELCLPQRKELHFFDTDRFFAAEPVDYGPYHAAFAPGPMTHGFDSAPVEILRLSPSTL